MVQKEISSSYIDEACGKKVFETSPFCEDHLKEFLVKVINNKGIDPIDYLNIHVLKVILNNNKIKGPAEDEPDFEKKLKQVRNLNKLIYLKSYQ